MEKPFLFKTVYKHKICQLYFTAPKGGKKISIASYFSVEVSAAERLNDLLKVAPKLSVGGSQKPQHDPIHLLSTHMAVVGVGLLSCNVY